MLNTPQYKQAAKVADLCARRRTLEGLIRTFAGGTGAIVQAKVDINDEEAGRKALQDEVDRRRKNNVAAPHLETYLKYTAEQRKKIETDAADLCDKVYIANQPLPHQFALSPKQVAP